MSQFSMAELRDMAPAYVLGALTPDEHAAFERALPTSPELVQEVAAYRAVVTRIATDVELAPPTALRAKFLDRIATQPQASAADGKSAGEAADVKLASASGASASGASASGASASGASASGASASGAPASHAARPAMSISNGGTSNKITGTHERPKGDRWWLTSIMAVGLAASLLFALQRNSQVSTLTTELAQREAALLEKTVKLAQRDSALNTVLEAERNLVLVSLGTVDNGPGIQFFWNVKERRGVLHAFNLKPAAPGRAYQLWLIKDGKPVPSRVFNADPDQHGLVWGIELPENTKGVSALAITDEPAGGSPQPTTTPFLVGELPKALQ